MIRILHVLDDGLNWGARKTLGQLLSRLGPDRVEHHVASIGLGVFPNGAPGCGPVTRVGPTLGWTGISSLLQIRKLIGPRRIDLIHAWGLRATAAVVPLTERIPVVSSLDFPGFAFDRKRWLNALRDESLRIICPAETVRRRLVENGIGPEGCVVVRPGVDLAAINEAKRRVRRSELGLTDDQWVMLTIEPMHRREGQYNAVWATALLHQIHPNVRLIVPGRWPEVDRLRRFARGFSLSHLLVTPGEAYSFEALLGMANMLVVPAEDDISTTPLAWAMGSGATLVGSAIHSIAELLADRHNGFLCKPGEPAQLAGKLLAAWEDDEVRRQVTDTARSQAYEIFGVRRCVDQHLAIYENALADREIGQGVTDSAIKT